MKKRVGTVVAVAALLSVTMPVVAATVATVRAKAAAAAGSTTWTHLAPSASPPALIDPAMAYDENSGQQVLVGALAADTQDETWVWAGLTWQQLSPTHSPPPLVGASMAYDGAGSLILFGGQNPATSAPSGQTWKWNGSDWALWAGVGPAARAYASMALDPHNNQIVLFGGTADGGTTVDNDSWVWGTYSGTWTSIGTSAAIGANGLRSAQIGYDSFKQTLIMHGGLPATGGAQFDYYYVWNTAINNWDHWYNVLPVSAAGGNTLYTPGALGAAAMAYDSITNQLIEFGGSSGFTSSGTWDYVADTPVTVSTSPGPRTFAAMAYDEASGQLLLFGGNTGLGNANDTWSYGPPPPPTTCAGFTDNFAADTQGLGPNWQTPSPLLAALASSIPSNNAPPLPPAEVYVPYYDRPAINGTGTLSIGAGSLQMNGVQSAASCSGPLTFETHVTPIQYAGVSFGVDLVSADLTKALSVEANFSPTSNGIWVGANLGSGYGNGTLLVANPPQNATYDVKISLDAAGSALIVVSGYGGSASITLSIGTGPFSVILENRGTILSAAGEESFWADATLTPQPTTNTVRLFYAAPSSDGTSLSIGGLVDDPNNPNTTYSLQIDTTGSCTSPGTPYEAPNVSVTTDANGVGYFANTFPTFGVPSFVELSSTTPFAFSNCYPVGPDNTAWENAASIPLVDGGGTTSGQIALPGESRWYKFQSTPDSKATVTLSGLSDDYAVAVYSDISQADTTTSGGTSSLNQLSAESSPDTFSPSAFIPSAFIPSAFIPSAFIPSAFIPSAFIPSAFIPSAFIPSAFIPSNYSPSAFIPSAFIPSAFIPSAFIPSAFIPSAFIPSAFIPSAFIPSAFIPSTYSSAINRSLITYNDEGGTADKTATVNTWTSTGTFYIRVASRSGASDTNSRFQVSVNYGSGACASTVVPMGAPPVAAPAAGIRTVILTDSSRLTGFPSEQTDLSTQLHALAARPEVNGVIVDLAGDNRVQALNTQADNNRSCPYAKNLVAGAVRDIVTSYRANNPVAYVVIAGPDNVVPFFRHPDRTLMGNENGYTPPLADNSPSQASLRLSYTLSDNDYGSNTVLQTQSDAFPVPDVAVGRLVKTEPEISGQIQTYLANTGGVLPAPTSSLVTGYDFLTLPANSVAGDLGAGIGTAPDTLIAPRTQAPTGSWTATDLKNKVLNSGRHDVIFLAGHFSANDTLAADYTTDMITTDMEQSAVNLKNTLVFSAGCHSGYDIVNQDAVPNVTLTLDWPEELARKQAILIGGTGYQYGDTDFIAYSEQIYADFAHQLRMGTGPVSIGQALLKAKQDYLTNTPQMGAMNQKAVYESELYGLPMESINMPAGRIPVPSDTSIVPSVAPATTDPGQTLGLSSADVSIHPTTTPNTVTVQDLTNSNTSVGATYLSGDNGTVTNPYQPVLPLESENVSVPGQSLRGALFLGGTYSDTHGVTPLTGAPTTEIRGVHTGFSSSVFFPEKPWSVNYFDALDGHGTGATRLMVTPAQHVSDPSPATTDTRRAYDAMSFRLYYSANTATYGSGSSASTPALSNPPDIVEVQAVTDADNQHIDVCASIGGSTSSGVQDVVATFTDPTQPRPGWQSVHLSQRGCPAVPYNDPTLSVTDSTSWGGQIALGPSAAANVQFLIQAVGGTGQVSVDDNLGRYYAVGQPLSCCYRALTGVTVTSPTVAPYGSSASVTATLTAFNPNTGTTGAAVPGETVTFSIGNQQATAVTDANGNAQASVPLDVLPGTYSVSAALVDPPDGFIAPAADAPQQITVTRQPTLLTLSAPAVGTDTHVVANLCATLSRTACTSTDPPVANRTVVFELSGPVNRITSVQTTSAGQAAFDAYGLPPGGYTLYAYFDGLIPAVGTPTDPYYAAAPVATVQFTTTTPYTTPPTLSVPANIAVVTANPKGAVVPYVASATDPVDPRPQVSCSPSSVSLFAIGITSVGCTAVDTAGNSTTKTFTVTVSPPYVPLAKGTTTCNGTYGGTGADVVVPSGAVCQLVPGASITDSITVQAGGSVSTLGVKVTNNVTLTGAKPSTLCGLTIGGNLTVQNTPAGGAPIVIGDTANGCSSGDTVKGTVTISGNKGPVDLGSTTTGSWTVSGDVTVRANSGPITLNADQLGHDLSATGNTGAVTITGSRIGHDVNAGSNGGPLVITGSQVAHDINVTSNTGKVTLSTNSSGHDITVSSNTGTVTVTANHTANDLVVQGNRPGGATVSNNTAGHDATCSGNTPQAGSGNVAGSARTCPA